MIKYLKQNIDERGALVAVEAKRDISFDIKRVFYIYGNNKCLPRASHANTKCKLAFICINGSCQIHLKSKNYNELVCLKSPEQIIEAQEKTWIELDEFSSDCILLVLASEYYNKDTYINDLLEFEELIK